MTEKNSPLTRALEIVNTLWVPAMVLYFIDHVGPTKSLGLPFGFHRFVDPALALAAKVILLSWLWGLMLETLTGENTIARIRNFKFSLKKGWWIVAVTLVIPQAVHLLIFLTAGHEALSRAFLTKVFYVFTTYWAAGEFFRIKYGHLLTRRFSDLFCSWPLVLYGAVFFTLSMLLYGLETKITSEPLAEPFLEILGIQIQFLTFTVFSGIFIREYPEVLKNFQSAKTLILVNPPAGSIRSETFAPLVLRHYPLFFAILKALTPPEYRVIEYNRVTWRRHFYQGHALVAISCFTTNCATAYHIAAEFRRRGCKVVLGGPHVTFFPQEALEFCDSVVIGAAESAWPQIIRDYENNTLQRLYHGECSENECARVHEFLKESPGEIVRDCLQISPGCKFNCYFCCVSSLTGELRQKKAIDEMLPLIRKCSGKITPLVFLDNNIYENPAYAKELFRAMIPLKTFWGGSTTIDIAKDDATVRLLKESGCYQLLIGYEIDAGSQMQDKRGKFAMAKNYLPLTRKLQKAGILIQGQFIFGFPGDSWGSLARLWKFCFKLSPTMTFVSFLTPLPGSPYFEECVREEKLINLNWRCYDLMRQVAVTPRLKSSWLLQNGFTPICFIIFFTTSFVGRVLLVLAVIMEFVYYNVR